MNNKKILPQPYLLPAQEKQEVKTLQMTSKNNFLWARFFPISIRYPVYRAKILLKTTHFGKIKVHLTNMVPFYLNLVTKVLCVRKKL